MVRAAGVIAAFTLAILVGAAPALAAGSTRVGKPPPVPAGASAAGQLPGSTQLHLTIVMQPRDSSGLQAYADAVSTPGSPVFHQYLTVLQFVAKFGPLPSQVHRVQAALQGQGLKVKSVSANQLALQIDATAAQVEQAFSVRLQQYVLPSGRKAFVNSSAPALPPDAAPLVGGVLGLDSLALPRPHDIQRKPAGAKPPTGTTTTTTTSTSTTTSTTTTTSSTSTTTSTTTTASAPRACAAAASVGEYTAPQIASAYGYSSLYSAGDLGAGQTIALYELEPNIASDITAYQACYGTSASVSYVPVDGGPGAFHSGDGAETELDIEDALGLAPKASFIVYQGPNSNNGAYDTYNAIISANRAKVISTSWGLCEAFTGSTYAQAENTLFQEAAVQGQSIFAASGDSGSEDCGSSALGVDDPASQPYVTGVGGTTMSALGPPPTQRVWNNSYGAGGGGISALWGMPSYQSGAASSLKVIGSQSSGLPCGASPGYCREVPDVAAAADPNTGYAIYYNGAWGGIGGTSGAAPTWAAFAALTNASATCAGKPIGFANPLLYQAASRAFTTAFSDVTTGNNDATGTNSGRFTAATGYDMATGLGTPQGSALASAMCGGSPGTSTVSVTNPGSQTGRVGTAASLQIQASASDGGTLTYHATGLPTGLSINSATGLISGTPSTAGTFNVTVTASEGSGASGSASFSWVLSSSTGTASVSLTNPGPQHTRIKTFVSLQIHASASDGGTLTYSATGLPAGLSINASTGVISGFPSTLGTFNVTVRAVDGTGPSASTSFTWTVATT